MGVSNTTCCTVLAVAATISSMDSNVFTSTSGTKAKAALRVDTAIAGPFTLKLTDSTGANTLELGFVAGPKIYYKTLTANNTVSNLLSTSTYYVFSIEADNDQNTVFFKVDYATGGNVWTSGSFTLWSSYPHNNFNKVSIWTNSPTSGFSGYVDDVKVYNK